MTRLSRTIAGFVTAATLACVAAPASATPQLRFQIDVEGDFALVGNTIGHDCANGIPAPVVGTVGACGGSVSDSAPDVFWRSDSPTDGAAAANTGIAVADARSTAVLALPGAADVRYARLYWAAMSPDGQADTSVLFERPGVFSQTLTADTTPHTLPISTVGLYQSSADVTALVVEHGPGAFRVGDVTSVALPNSSEARAFVAWTLVVFYGEAGAPLRQLTLFDALDSANTGSGAVVNISGFLVPQAGIDAKLGIVAYNSDGQTGGDTLSFNGTEISDGLGGTNNFFNGSKTLLGAPLSRVGDLPQLTGGVRSHAGVDIDVVDVTTLVAPNDTTAVAVAKAGGDLNVVLGTLVTSITTYKPNFNDSIKSAVDLNGGGLVAGDVLRYTVDVVNTGNDPAINVVFNDALPTGVSFVPGSIQIVSGANAGAKTDIAGDDQGEYDAATRTVRVRLGAGATATVGGTMQVDEVSQVSFDVTIDSLTIGLVSNQAVITAAGLLGAPTTNYTSRDPNATGPTDVIVDECDDDGNCPVSRPICLFALTTGEPNVCVQCLTNDDCSGTTPVCDANNECVPCATDGDCTDPLLPACQPSGALAGACTECSASNADLCGGNDPICLTTQGVCGCTDTDGDSECGGPTSGIICSGPAGTCVPGCSTAPNRNDCPATSFCSAQDGTVGTCSPQPCNSNADCAVPFPVCDTSGVPNECVQCLANTDCAQPLVCETTSRTCVECTPTELANCTASGTGATCLLDNTCGCTTDAHCGTVTSGRVCDTAVSKCAIGCRGTGGNGCPSGLVCTSTTSAIGSCVECVSDAQCAAPTPFCNTQANECIQCRNNGDCSGATPTCNAGVCEACASDADCTNPLLPACQIGGALAGRCTQCSGSNDNLCGGDNPICLQSGVCGCTDTDGDSECGAPDSGRICSGSAGSCVDGCSTAPTRNNCPSGDYCTEQGGAIGTCEPRCMVDTDCTTAPNLVCDTAPIPHECVQCLDNTDCNAPLVCNPATRTCIGCLSDADCTIAPFNTCDTNSQTCVDCLADADCTTAPNNTCDTTTNTCVDCLADADCTTAANNTCDTATNTCVDCLDNTGCQAPTVCDTQAMQCVGCLSDADCTAPSVCDETTQTCVGCVVDADCTTAPDNTCNTATQTCVDCLDNGDCGAGTVCDTTAMVCVGCVVDADCTVAPDNTCNTATQTCVDCLADADCGAGTVCDTAAMVCVECVDSADCTVDPNNTCNTATQTCVDCLADADCGAGFVCDTTAMACVECIDNADCPDGVCDTTTQTCVGCVNDADCTGGVCDPNTQTCVECVEDEDCTAPDVCDPDTLTCVGCVDDGDCSPNTTCDTGTQTCVGCLDNQDCAAPDVCDVDTQTCVECLVDGDCPDGVCDTAGNVCVGCLDNQDCTAPDVCDPDSQTCVECTPDDASACSADGNGAACMPDNTCGCNSDSDCGSGRICDPENEVCVVGCRGEGGNGCPDGEVCSSTTEEPGECVPAPDSGFNGVVEGGGCACSTPARRTDNSAALWLAGIGALAAFARRRRR